MLSWSCASLCRTNLEPKADANANASANDNAHSHRPKSFDSALNIESSQHLSRRRQLSTPHFALTSASSSCLIHVDHNRHQHRTQQADTHLQSTPYNGLAGLTTTDENHHPPFLFFAGHWPSAPSLSLSLLLVLVLALTLALALALASALARPPFLSLAISRSSDRSPDSYRDTVLQISYVSGPRELVDVAVSSRLGPPPDQRRTATFLSCLSD